jgi:hypothetical protein
MVLSELIKALSKGRTLVVCAFASLAIAGCTSNPTNEPSAAEIEKANADRFAAIDNNPNYTPAQKEAMKSRMGGYQKSAGTERPR